MNWLVTFLRALSPNCREAIRLQSEALDHPLPRLRRIGVGIHLALCVWCSRYGKQIKFLRTAARHGGGQTGGGPALAPEARERILRALRDRERLGPSDES